MIVTYNGKNYSGYQIQKNGNTIQEELEKAIEIITKQKTTCVASGRTDAKVSAYAQAVHFDIEQTLNEFKFLNSINGILPDDIKVLSIAPTELHARFSAKRKTYVYKMYMSKIDLPLYANSLQINPEINIKEMNKFIKLLVGTHDFKGFQSSGSPTETTVRTIYKASLKQNGLCLTFSITGNGFLYKMVRNIVGTMLKIGEGRLTLKELKPTLFTTFKATATAKPDYLYLFNVEYPN